jgi:hypothetical protein
VTEKEAREEEYRKWNRERFERFCVAFCLDPADSTYDEEDHFATEEFKAGWKAGRAFAKRKKKKR